MIDLHTHILPGVDDGAATIDESMRLLHMEVADGVNSVALTPHFRFGVMKLDRFVERRNRAHEQLRRAVESEGLQIRLVPGAEVAFSAALTEMDLTPLCYEGTQTILIELPTDHYPKYTHDVLYELRLQGYTPTLAHVERYSYFARKPKLLETLVDMGAYAQVNADSLLGGWKMRRRVLAMIRGGLVHVVATDTHGINRRPPMLSRALKIVEEKTGKDLAVR